jgi:hypothetical protein
MKKTLLLTLALIAVGCTESGEIDMNLLSGRINSEVKNISELKRLGSEWVDPKTLEPYSGKVLELDREDSTRITKTYSMWNGRLHGAYEWHGLGEHHIEFGYYDKGSKCDEWLELPSVEEAMKNNPYASLPITNLGNRTEEEEMRAIELQVSAGFLEPQATTYSPCSMDINGWD